MAKSTHAKGTKPSAPNEAATGGGYTVLARRYRSRDFDEIVGQEPIARTLKNAIASGRIAHAYLFCGTRGVGKTSMARIFAKAINATPNLSEKDRIADAILRGEDLDVIEIDAASNRGIANIKEVIANAIISPARCPYKIYIIDEVHMLSNDAFNALLKTMEEPPSHVKFILCTTEAHKVPATIQSRCQRFDFRPLAATQIAEQLRHVLESEGIKAEDEAVAHMARLGNGSMRDALSLLDRALSVGEEKVTAAMLEEILGLPDRELISAVVDAVAAGDAKQGLIAADAVLRAGVSVEQALDALAEHLRTLMVVNLCGSESDLLELSEVPIDKAAQQATHFDGPALVHAIALCDAASRNAARSSAARAMFDVVVVRLCMAEHFADIAALMGGKAPAPRLPAGGRAATEASSVEPKKKDTPLVEVPRRNAVEPRREAAPAAPPIVSTSQDEIDDKLETAMRVPAVAVTMELFRGQIVDVQPVRAAAAETAGDADDAAEDDEVPANTFVAISNEPEDEEQGDV
jgi:DNA polymerase-3 subunit gamma/tau